MAFEHAVVLTGGIATGKSTVAKYLKEHGFSIVDADSIAHTILDEQHRQIAGMFGESCVEAQKVKRKVLGAIVFADGAKRKQLECLLHPLIYNEIVRQSSWLERDKKPYLIDIPLFFEGGRYPIKHSLVVYTTKEQQLERLMQRDKSSRKEALRRITAQMDIEEKRKRATFVIDNRGDLKALQDECDKIVQRLQEILGDFSDSN